MSTLPEVSIIVQDGGLGILPQSNNNVEVTVGIASSAIPNQLYSAGDIQTLKAQLGFGPGAEAAALKLATGGGGNSQLFISPTPNYDGAVGAVSHVGTGLGGVAVSFAPLQTITMRCTLGGALGVAKFNFQLGSGPASVPVTSGATPWVYQVPGTMTTLTLTGGATNSAINDTWTVSPTGVVVGAIANGGTGDAVLTQASQPVDTYPLSVVVSTTGGYNTAPGPTTTGVVSSTGYFTYGLDQDPITGLAYSLSAPIQIPPSGKYAIPNSGLVLAFTQQTLVVKITTTGILGVMAFDYNLAGAGFTGSPILSSAGTTYSYTIPGTGITITFLAHSYPINVTYTYTSTGGFTLGGGGVAGDNLVSVANNSFVADDIYSAQTIASGYSYANLLATLNALILNPQGFSVIHVVGAPGSAAAAETVALGVEGVLATAFGEFRYLRAITECPTVGTWILSGGVPVADTADTDSRLLDPTLGFGNFVSTRVGVGAGDAIFTGLLGGQFLRRNAAYVATARIAEVPVSEDLGWVGRGALPYTRYLFRDEAKTPGLDAGRFTTLRTFQGLIGYYITRGRLMALPTSNFKFIQYGRVMDLACQITRSALLPFVNSSVRVNTKTGFIDERDAQVIEGVCKSALNAGLLSFGYASGANVQLSRTANILATGVEPVTISIIPLGYLSQIESTIGFLNPATVA